MKVYRVHYQTDGGWVNEWFATKAEAKQAIKEIKNERKDDEINGDGLLDSEPELKVIPTDKKGLVRWLNLWHGGARL